MKKWITALAALMMAVFISVPVYATSGEISTEGAPPDDEDEAIVVYDWETGQPVSNNGSTGQIGGPAPIDIRMEMVGDVPYITRYYEIEGELGLAEVPQGFEQDGYRFTRHDLLKQEIPATVDTKDDSKTQVVPCEKKDVAALLQLADSEIKYDEGGYSGILKPDVESIRFEEGERSSYSYTLTETREYPGLLANDASYIDKTITKNGATLYLDGIEWVVTGTSPTDTGLVPTQYKGIATYSGRASGSKVSSYTAYITYSGVVNKTTPGITTYAVIYRGVPVPPAEPVIEAQPPKAQVSFLWFWCIVGVLAIGGVAAFFVVRSKRNYHGSDGLFGDIWEGRDEAYEAAAEAVAAEPDQPTSIFEPQPAQSVEDSGDARKADTAASILAAIEGIDGTEAAKPRRRPGSRKEQIPLVEKIDGTKED